MEVFNVLNANDLRLFSYEPSKGDFSQVDTALLALPIQSDGERRFGRRFQVGIQFQFQTGATSATGRRPHHL